MRFKEFLVELDMKKPSKKEKDKQAFKDLHAQQQQKKANDFEARWNTGMPAKIKLKVYTSKPSWTGEDRYHEEEFIIDNLLAIRHKLDGVALIDMSKSMVDQSKHREKASYAVMQHSKNSMGSIAEYLHGLPSGTRKKPGFAPNDLRREAWTDSPIPYKLVYKEAKGALTQKEVKDRLGANASFYFEQLGIHDGGNENKTVSCTAEDESGKKWKLTRIGKYEQYKYTLEPIVTEAAMRILQKDVTKGAKFSLGKRQIVVTGAPNKENGEKVTYEVDGVEKTPSKLYAFVLWLNDNGFEKGGRKPVKEAADKPARNDIEAFVEPYIRKLVGKKAGTSVSIPMRIKPKDGKVYANAPRIAFRNAVSLWMNRLISKSKPGWWSMENTNDQHHTNHLKITLKKDHEVTK